MQKYNYSQAFRVEQSTLWAIRALAHAGYSAWEQPISDVDELCDTLITEMYKGFALIGYVDVDARNVDVHNVDAYGAIPVDIDISSPDDFMPNICSVEHATYVTVVDSRNLNYVQRALVACNYISATALPPIMDSDEVLYVVWNHIMRTYAVSDTQPSDVAVLHMGDNIADYSAFQYGPQGDLAVPFSQDWSKVAVGIDSTTAAVVDSIAAANPLTTPQIYYCPGYELLGVLADIFGDEFSIPVHIALHATQNPGAIFLIDRSQQLVWKGEPLC